MEIKRFFEERLDTYGDSPRALDCSAEGQRRRFEVLSEMADLSGKSILDLGSGLGHLYGFLTNRFTRLEYTGYDFSARFVSAAAAKYPEARFETHDALKEGISESFDFVLCSGIHNLETGSNDEDMVYLLRTAWGAAREGIGFNMLSTYADRKEEGRHYYDPQRMLAEALRLTRFTVLRQDYMPHDFTLYLYRQLPKKG